jgi:general stress protein YciG
MNAATQLAWNSTEATQPAVKEAVEPQKRFDENGVEVPPESREMLKADAAVAAEPVKVRKPRGFAAMDRALVSAIARKGGKAAHEAGTAHEFTREEAREAGRKGGQATHAKRRAKNAISST